MSGSLRFLVIGSNSYTGATFVAHALTRGHEVVGVSRSDELNPVFLPYRWGPADSLKRFSFLRMDLNEKAEEIARLARDRDLGYVANFAAQSMVAESWLTPVHWYQTNVVANVRLHEELRKWGGLKKYLHVTTPEVYGSCSGVVKEDAPSNPSTPYAASRAACDLHLMTFFKRYNFPVVFTRAANVYGPGQQLYRILPRAALFSRLGKKLPLHGGGHSTRAFIHGEDVASASLAILERGTPGEVYHLSTDRFISIRDLVAMVAQKTGTSFAKLAEVTEDRPGKDAAYLLDSTKAKKQFAWNPRIGLEEGVDSVIRWIDGNLSVLRGLPDHYIHKP
jgi:dTDP-glucose 4,6-dehydratase